jgi:hypothetical protein
MTNDPHYREAAAACAAVAEHYGSPAQGEGRYWRGRLVSTFSVGQDVNVQFPDGHRRCVVLSCTDYEENTYHVVEHVPGGARRHHEITGDRIAAF